MRNAKIKEKQQLQFYQSVVNMSRNETYDRCIDLIESSHKPNYTLMNRMKSMGKDQLTLAMHNFIMKGHGYGI